MELSNDYVIMKGAKISELIVSLDMECVELSYDRMIRTAAVLYSCCGVLDMYVEPIYNKQYSYQLTIIIG